MSIRSYTAANTEPFTTTNQRLGNVPQEHLIRYEIYQTYKDNQQ